MNLYTVTAAGYYTTGTAVVAANSAEEAAELANEASKYSTPGKNFGGVMTYHSLNAKLVGTAHDETSFKYNTVVSLHEWGMPELPAKGSGKTVTF